VDRSPLALESRSAGPQYQRAPPGAGTQRCASCRDPKWAPGFGTQKLLGPQDPKAPLGAGTRFGVQGSGWL
jgi:hypothetical protein